MSRRRGAELPEWIHRLRADEKFVFGHERSYGLASGRALKVVPSAQSHTWPTVLEAAVYPTAPPITQPITPPTLVPRPGSKAGPKPAPKEPKTLQPAHAPAQPATFSDAVRSGLEDSTTSIVSSVTPTTTRTLPPHLKYFAAL